MNKWKQETKSWKELFFCFLGPHLQKLMEIRRLGVRSELQMPATATAPAQPDPRLICDLLPTAHGNTRSLTH